MYVTVGWGGRDRERGEGGREGGRVRERGGGEKRGREGEEREGRGRERERGRKREREREGGGERPKTSTIPMREQRVYSHLWYPVTTITLPIIF